ncbi:MAG: response regulator transcription factor [Flavipsychrobacter sp.]|nr:response regulator transcription factor [Flavipsychrobacter sp.]
MSRRITLSIVDDQLIFVAGLTAAIRKMGGIEVTCCVRDAACLRTGYSTVSPEPSICLVGINAPDNRYYNLVAELKETLPRTKILALSTHPHEFNLVRLLQKGADGYLSKACGPRELERALLTLYYSGVYFEGLPASELDLYDRQRELFLSARESQFLALLCSEMSYPEIGQALQLAPTQVEHFEEMLLRKLKAQSRIGLVVAAYIMGVNRSVGCN